MSTVPAPMPEAGRVRSWVDFYATSMRTQISSQFQYRAAAYMYLLGMVAEPVIYLVVWTTIAEDSGGTVGGLTTGELRRVLHRLDVRPQHEPRLHAIWLGVADPRG